MIKFDCPHCSQPIEAPNEMLNMEADCPSCGKKVKVHETLPGSDSEGPLEYIRRKRAEQPSQTTQTKAEKIHESATTLSVIALMFILFGGAALLISLILSLNGTDAWIGFGICAGLVGTGTWFYLIAQIVHIRALLEKRKD